jgi:hypothetical protein
VLVVLVVLLVLLLPHLVHLRVRPSPFVPLPGACLQLG